MSRAAPKWLHTEFVLAIHDAILRAHGGLAGVRDAGLLDPALARPKNLFAYESGDLFALSASYAFGLARNHPFVDGNKRTAFVASVTFLEQNRCAFRAAEDEAVVRMVSLAQGTSSEESFAEWLRANSRSAGKRSPKKRRT